VWREVVEGLAPAWHAPVLRGLLMFDLPNEATAAAVAEGG
jgi:hypothetical protein